MTAWPVMWICLDEITRLFLPMKMPVVEGIGDIPVWL